MKVKGIRPEVLDSLQLVGNYEITTELIDSFCSKYTGKVDPHTRCTKQQVSYNRKLAALSLVKHKRLLGIPNSEIHEGFIYIVENPAWDGHYKVGRSIDPRDRLKSYQTSSPYRDFRICGWYFTSDSRTSEANIHKELEAFCIEGEWFKTNSLKVIQDVVQKQIKER